MINQPLYEKVQLKQINITIEAVKDYASLGQKK